MYTGWPVAKAVEKADASTVAYFLYEEVFCMYGPFLSLLSDNGTHFDAEVIDRFLNILKVKHKFTTPYRPECNGMNEKLNGTLSRIVKRTAVRDPDTWDEHISAALYAYRTKIHQKLKISPYQMLFGQEVGTGDPLMQLGTELVGQARYGLLTDRNRLNELLHGESNFTATHVGNNKRIHVGDTVLKLRHRRKMKLDSNFEPERFKVVATYNNNTYKLSDMSGRLLKRNVNHSNLQRILVDSHMGGE